MTLPATDSFTRANGALGADWAGSVGSDLSISSNEVTGASATDSAMYWTTDTPNNDQRAKCTLKTISAGQYAGPFVRGSATDFVLLVAQSNTDYQIQWYNGGAWTQIGSTYAVAPANGDVLEIRVEGTTFKGFINGVERISGSNGSAPASGNGGLYVYNNSARVDDFEVDNLATLEQEGFRFGVDDGSESAHTWEAAQDTNISTAAGESRLLRILVNATGDPAAIAFKLKYQKNGSGGYGAVPIGATGVGTTPVIEAGDTTSSGDNATTPTSPWAVSRPTAATGDLLIMIIGWDDSTNNTGISVANGPNGEVWSQIGSVVSSASTEARMTAYYVVATGSWGAGSISVTPNANEQWTATVIKVLAGEFDASTPIGASNTRASAGTAETSALSPSLTAGASDGGGRLIWAVTTDTDPLVTLQAGNTSIANNDRGNEALGVAIRDTAVTNSESIAGGATWSLAGDSWCSITFVVRAPIVNNDYYITTSANIAAGGEDTTARLTAPSAKSTSDFVTGRRWDNENGTDTTNITTDDYSEFEYFLTVRSGLSASDYFDSRMYNGDTAIDTYTTTPRWTISAVLSATVNQVTETDTAQAIAKRKTKAVGQVTETDTAQAITERKIRAVAQVTETDTAQAITRRKVRAVGQVTETDTAQAITRSFGTTTVAVAQVTETDTAQAITERKIKTLAQVTETDTAQALTERKVKAVGQVTETDTAQALTERKVKAVAQVTETDTAQTIAKRKIKAVGQVTETDTAQAIAKRKIKAVGQVTETDTAQPISSVAGVLVGQAVETDTAQAITRRKVRAVGQVTETDTAQALLAVKVVLVQQVSESDLAQSLFPFKYVSVVQVIETDLAQAIGIAKFVSVGQAVETDTAQSISTKPIVYVLLGQAVETELAFAMRYEYSRKVGLKIPERRRSTLSDGEPLTGLSKRSPRRLYK